MAKPHPNPSNPMDWPEAEGSERQGKRRPKPELSPYWHVVDDPALMHDMTLELLRDLWGPWTTDRIGQPEMLKILTICQFNLDATAKAMMPPLLSDLMVPDPPASRKRVIPRQ